MKVSVTYDTTHAHFELIPESNIDKMCIDSIATAQTATVKRNGTATFTVEVPRTEIGKYVVNKDNSNG